VSQKQTGILGELTRGELVSQAHPAAYVAQRQGLLNTAAAQISRRGVMAAKAELANTALMTLIKVLYEPDTNGKAVNVDPHGGRVLIPLPWGRMGAKQWNLRASEARTLRFIMFNRTESHDPAPLLDYDADGRHWFLSLSHYPSLRRALTHLQDYPITVDEWRAAWQATRTRWAAKNMATE
jgi:hypothetical protein